MKGSAPTDHMGARISELEWVRRQSDERRRYVYERQIAARTDRRRELRQALARSWESRRAAGLARAIGKLVLHVLSPRPARPLVSKPARDDAAWWRGIEDRRTIARPLLPFARWERPRGQPPATA